MAIAPALEKSTKAARKSNVSRNKTAQVQVKAGKVKRKMQYLTEAMGGRSGPVGGTKMSPKGVKFLKFCKKYFCLQNPIWPPVVRPALGLALKGLIYYH